MVIGVLLIGSAVTLRFHWYPWGLERTWSLAAPVDYPKNSFVSVQFTPDGKRLLALWAVDQIVAAGPPTSIFRPRTPPTISMVDVETGQQVWSFDDRCDWSGLDAKCVLSPGGKLVCIGRSLESDHFSQTHVKLLNAATSVPIAFSESFVRAMQESLSAPAVGKEGSAPIHSPLTQGLLCDYVILANDDSMIAIGWSNKVYVFDPLIGEEICVLNGNGATPLNFSPNKRWISVWTAAGGNEFHQIWELPKGENRGTFQLNVNDNRDRVDNEGHFEAEEAAPNGREFYWHFRVRSDGKEPVKPKPPWSRAGRNFAVDTPGIRIVAADTWKTIQVLDENPGASVSITNDDERIASVNRDGDVRVWRLRHPAVWCGVAWLPEFWLTLLLACALLWSLRRDWRKRRS